MPIDPPDGGPDDWFVPASDGYPDDWFVPTSDGYPDDWFVPASAAPATAQPAPGPQPGTANPALATRPAPRPDPLTAFLSLIPASKWVTPPPIFPNSLGQFPLPAPAPLSISRIDPTRSFLGSLANLPATNAPTGGFLGSLANLPSANPAAFRSYQGAALASGGSGQSASAPFLSSLANLASSSPPTAAGSSHNAVSDAPRGNTDSNDADAQNRVDHFDEVQAQDQGAPFDGLANPDAAESLRSQAAYNDCLKENGRGGPFEVGRFRFCTAGPRAGGETDNGTSLIVSSPTYGYDPATGAYATFEASPQNVLEFFEHRDGRVTIAPFGTPR